MENVFGWLAAVIFLVVVLPTVGWFSNDANRRRKN